MPHGRTTLARTGEAEGYKVRQGKAQGGAGSRGAAGWVEAQPTLSIIAKALLAARATLSRELRGLEKRTREMARTDARTRLLMTPPGVGPIVGLTFAAAIDDPARLRSSKQVGAHFRADAKKISVGREGCR